MKIKRRHKEAAEVSTESMNDIMFFLLLFFLIISTLASPSVLKLTLPKSGTNSTMDKQQITIEVDANHQYVINKTHIEFADLENAIKIQMQTLQTPTVILKFDNTLTVQDLADVMQIGYNLGAKMVLATKPTNK